MTNPLVSVIIPFYSNLLWLEQALESVYNQTYENVEVIVVNDGSNEDIGDIHKKYEQLKLFYQENSGPAVARNVGIKMAKGEYLAFLDSDDLWINTKLELQIEYMIQNNLLWSHTNYFKFYNNTDVIKEVNTKFDGNILPLCFIWNPIATPTIVINRLVFYDYKISGFDETTKIGEDSYLWQEIAKHSKLGHLNNCLTKVRIRGENAAYDSYKQLLYRSSTIERIRAHKNLFDNIYIYYHFIFILYYCNWVSKLIKPFYFNTYNLRNAISNILYVFPYVNFKFLKYLLLKSVEI